MGLKISSDATASQVEHHRTQISAMRAQVDRIEVELFAGPFLHAGVSVDDLIPGLEEAKRLAQQIADEAGATASLYILQESHGLLGDLVTVAGNLLDALRKPPAVVGSDLDHARAAAAQMMAPNWIAPHGSRSAGEIGWIHRARALLAFLRTLALNSTGLGALLDETKTAHAQVMDFQKQSAEVFALLKDAPARWTQLRFAQQYVDESKARGAAAVGFVALAVGLGCALVGLLSAWPVGSIRDNQWIVFFVCEFRKL